MVRHTHWGAIAFTLTVAAIVVGIVGPRLLRPLPLPPVDADPSEEPTAAPTLDHTPLAAELHSAWVAQAKPLTLAAGESGEVWFTFRNIGSVPWIRGGSSELRLGEVGARPLVPEMRRDWLGWDRPGRQSEDLVRPMEVATIRVGVTGSIPGTFRLAVRPVVDGITWLEEQGVYVDITVEE